MADVFLLFHHHACGTCGTGGTGGNSQSGYDGFFGINSPKVMIISGKSCHFTVFFTFRLFISGIIITFAFSIQQDYTV